MQDTSYIQFTAPLTLDPQYVHLEQKPASVGDLWKKAHQVTPESLDTGSKLQKAARQANHSLTRGTLFKRDRYALDLVKLRQKTMFFAANTVLLSYAPEVKALEKSALAAEKAFLETVKNKELPTDAFKELLQKAVQDTALLQAKVEHALLEENNQPIVKDRRCDKKFIQALDRDYATPRHAQYEAKMQSALENQKIFKEYTQEQCWHSKGRRSALIRIKLQTVHLSNSLHATACCADALVKNAALENFWKKGEESSSSSGDEGLLNEPELALLMAALMKASRR